MKILIAALIALAFGTLPAAAQSQPNLPDPAPAPTNQPMGPVQESPIMQGGGGRLEPGQDGTMKGQSTKEQAEPPATQRPATAQ